MAQLCIGRMSWVMTSFRVVRLNGLVTKKFTPAAIAASAGCGSELADMITTGTLQIFGSARISRAAGNA